MGHVYGLDAEGEALLAGPVANVCAVARTHAADVDARGRFPEESLAALREAGLLGLCVDEAFGGQGRGPAAFAAAVEDLAGACASTAMVYVMHVSATQPIATSSTHRGREALLREIAAGRHLTTLAFSEKGSRSHFWAPVSRETAKGGQVS
ncbi:MAG TPA: acyl-CoA dehydrogenase family protein, partial [Planctomycetota bacterium]|nr:acyl-CoA dehydrogenase family protein [Planctomycetota bacterium]